VSPRVLIVDDDPVARRVHHQVLVNAGYETLMAVDAMGALAQARTEKPDLILLDLGLPAGGGMLFLQRIAQFPALAMIPVIVISSRAREQHEPLALGAGARAYLEKPVNPKDLAARVRELLGDGAPPP